MTSLTDQGMITHLSAGTCTIKTMTRAAPQASAQSAPLPNTNGEFLVNLLRNAGTDYGNWKFNVQRPEGTRVLTVRDIADYVNNLSPTAFESIKNSLQSTIGRALKGAYDALKTYAEKAAHSGLGTIAT